MSPTSIRCISFKLFDTRIKGQSNYERYPRDTAVLDDTSQHADDWSGEVKVLRNCSKYRIKSMDTSPYFQSMWDRHFGSVNAAKYCIELFSGNKRLVYSAPYRARPKLRDFEKAKLEKMLAKVVLEVSVSKRVSPIVSTTNGDTPNQLFVGYRKLNAVTKRNLYQIPRLDEWIDFLGEADVFSTLNANCEY